MTDLDAALRAVVVAREVERLAEGSRGPRPGERRAKRQQLIEVTNARALSAVDLGATTVQVAEALGVGLSAARKRIAEARLERGEEAVALAPLPPRPAPPNVWREVPRCDRPAPPPWPVSARCSAGMDHDPSRHVWSAKGLEP